MINSFFSLFIIPIWITVFIVGSIIYYLLMLFFGSQNIHGFSRVLARIFILSGFQRFKIEGKHPNKDKGPYLYLFNHGSIFDPFMVIAAVPHYITGVGAIRKALRHEATHAIQKCNDNKTIGDIKKLESKLHQSKRKALEFSSSNFSGTYAKEVEAYVLEDKPKKVKNLIKKYCL